MALDRRARRATGQPAIWSLRLPRIRCTRLDSSISWGTGAGRCTPPDSSISPPPPGDCTAPDREVAPTTTALCPVEYTSALVWRRGGLGPERFAVWQRLH